MKRKFGAPRSSKERLSQSPDEKSSQQGTCPAAENGPLEQHGMDFHHGNVLWADRGTSDRGSSDRGESESFPQILDGNCGTQSVDRLRVGQVRFY
jgi:hypothetical protein